MSSLVAVNARGVLQLARDTVKNWRTPHSDRAWATSGGGPSIVLLHGLAGTPRMLSPLRGYLRGELERPTLELALGAGLGDIRDMAMRVHREIARQGIRQCDVVG